MDGPLYNPSSIPQAQYLTIEILNIVISVAGILGCLTLILSYILVKESRSFASRLVVYLIISNSIYALANIVNIIQLSSPMTTNMCNIQGIIREIGLTASLYFACYISLVLYRTTVKGDNLNHNSEKKGVIVGAILTLIMPLM